MPHHPGDDVDEPYLESRDAGDRFAPKAAVPLEVT
jgi:hypothetical protein